MLSEFNDYLLELIDLDLSDRPGERVMLGFDLNDTIKEWDNRGFWIFANQETHQLVGGAINLPEIFPILYIRLVRKTNSEILHNKRK